MPFRGLVPDSSHQQNGFSFRLYRTSDFAKRAPRSSRACGAGVQNVHQAVTKGVCCLLCWFGLLFFPPLVLLIIQRTFAFCFVLWMKGLTPPLPQAHALVGSIAPGCPAEERLVSVERRKMPIPLAPFTAQCAWLRKREIWIDYFFPFLKTCSEMTSLSKHCSL